MNFPTRQITVQVPALHLCEVAEVKQPFDLIFMVVKAYDTTWASHLVKPILAPDGFVIGLQNGISRAYFSGEPVSRSEIREVAASWAPYCSVATWYIWRSLDPLPVSY